ncbi:MAG: type II toxin-antitoxin system VapB family antitoxin [Lachnospiraceae bacterium]|jgi:antitoxin VapB|nr:type II toxin-antitoxin system VapB family antitoxin [Lachnospiraceae bacterium]
MDTAKIFTNGGSQAIRLPKSCRFEDDEVFVNRIGNIVMLIPKADKWNNMVRSIDYFTEDFMVETQTRLPLDKREEF